MSYPIAILLAVFNGARFLPQQLASFEEQLETGWQLFAGDDGSADESASILADFAGRFAKGKVQLRAGPKRGVAANFLSLLADVPESSKYIAFSDQDDVWLPGKLSCAISHLTKVPDDKPALYFSLSLVCGENLENPRLSYRYPRGPSFANALVQNIAPGNTMVFNRAALEVLRRGLPYAENVVLHDWWVYQVLSGAGATMIYDTKPTILYRQHGRNQIGANRSVVASLKRLWMLHSGQYADWYDRNLSALLPLSDGFDPANSDLLYQFNECRKASNGLKRVSQLRSLGIMHQKTPGQLKLLYAALIGKL